MVLTDLRGPCDHFSSVASCGCAGRKRPPCLGVFILFVVILQIRVVTQLLVGISGKQSETVVFMSRPFVSFWSRRKTVDSKGKLLVRGVRCRLHAISSASDARNIDWRTTTPNSSLSALQVVELQLQALQDNDALINDGLAKTFEFASPGNQATTGPLPRFAAMIRNGYPILLNSASFSVLSALSLGQDGYIVRVEVTGNDAVGSMRTRFQWRLSNHGQLGWKTDAVMPDIDPVE